MKKVVAILEPGFHPFGLGSLCELWNEPYHADDDNQVFDFRLVTPEPGLVHGSAFPVQVDHGLEHVLDADLVCVVPKESYRRADPRVVEVLRAADARGAWIFAHCSATFTLGVAGLIDGRRVTTHWRYAEELARLHPEAEVDKDVLYVHDGNLVTGAGAAAGLDAGLHLMRLVFGAREAATAAKRMVVPPHRDGGQAQFIDQPVPDCEAETLGPVLTWIVEHLDEDLSVEELARRHHMSPRTFARRFRAETGTTPHQWVIAQRVRRAEELLERSDRSVEWIASNVGFGNASALRHHFTRQRGVSPQQYRRTFAC